jgi:hypothetical protein
MTSLPLVRTEYLNVSTGTVRSGATSHGESLVDMESYLLRHDQISSSALHSWGVVEGLSTMAAPNPANLTVTPGVALDSAGHLIALAVGGFAIVDPTVDPTQVANVPTVPVTADGVVVATSGLTGDRYLTITWREVLDPSSTGNAPTLIHAPWLRLQLVADVSDTGEQVILAHVVLNDQSRIAALTADHRRLAGVPAGRVELRRTRTSAGPPLTVDQLAAGEIRATDSGGIGVNLLSPNGATQQVLVADPTGNLALRPGSGSVGIGLRGGSPDRVLHVEGNEVHSGGTGGGFSFASRTTGNFVEDPTAGERWVWYASAGTARLWSGSDQLTVGPDAGGLRLSAGTVGAPLELRANGGSLGKLALTANTVVARRADGSEPIVVDTVNGRIGQGTATPTHPLHITGNSGIRQNSLYLGGGPGWSSLSYNAFHDANNAGWVFPDPSRPAVTVEMDDLDGGRFQVWTTTTANTQAWQLRLAIDGKAGVVSIPGRLNVDALSAAGAVSLNAPVTVSAAGLSTALSVTNTASNALHVCASNAGSTAARIFGNTLGLFVQANTAASFTGDVTVNGRFSANSKQFVIDHPLDPENRTLTHASVESDEQAVLYGGNVDCDADGNATVRLPDWLEALATDFRYQLTCIGGQSTVYVSEEVRDGVFSIAGGSAGQRVSWLLIGVRQDPCALTHEMVVEEDKPEAERGFYHNPEAFGQDATASVPWVRHADAVEQHPVLAQRIARRHTEFHAERLRQQTERQQAASRK